MSVISRMKLTHPALGTAGGASLHAAIEAIYQKIGDMSTSRWFAQAGLNNGSSVDFEHNFVCNQFSDLRFDLYLYNTGTGEMTIVPSPRTGWTIVATPSQEKTHIRVTNGTGSAKDIALIVEQDPIELDELTDVILTSPAANQILKYNGTNWVNSAPTGVGFVPLGAIIPIASHLTGANAIPPTGTVVNGWQYCDGAAIPGGNSVSGNTPNLTDSRFLMGYNSAGTPLGSNSHTHSVTSNVTVGNHTAISLSNHSTLALNDHTALALSNHSALALNDHSSLALNAEASHTHSVAAHYHAGNINTGNANTNHTHTGGTGLAGAHSHTFYAFAHNNTYGGTGPVGVDDAGQQASTSSEPSHTHTFTTDGAGSDHYHNWSGNVGNTGGSNGDAAITSGAGSTHTHSFSQNISSHSWSTNISAHSFSQNISSHSFSTNISAHSFSQNIDAHTVGNNAVTSGSTSSLPQYLTVQYIIRVS